MPGELRKVRFSSDLAGTVAAFYCGHEPWEREVADWIRGVTPDDNVYVAMEKGCEVWLHGADQEGVVGFGSLGRARWRYPTERDRAVELSIIPMLGVQDRFRGMPEGPPEERYAAQILGDLIAEAMAHRERMPLLALYVHEKNMRAIRFYERAGFTPFRRRFGDNISMLLDLPVEA